jgi:hypothetical protein
MAAEKPVWNEVMFNGKRWWKIYWQKGDPVWLRGHSLLVRAPLLSSSSDSSILDTLHGRAIAEAVSRWLPTAASQVQYRVWSSGICGGQSGVGAGFLRVLWFPLPIIPPNSPFAQSPGAGTIGQWVADVPSGPSLDSTPTKQIKKNLDTLQNEKKIYNSNKPFPKSLTWKSTLQCLSKRRKYFDIRSSLVCKADAIYYVTDLGLEASWGYLRRIT